MQKRETAAPSSPQLGGLVRAASRKERRRPIAAAVRCIDAAQRKERIYNFNSTCSNEDGKITGCRSISHRARLTLSLSLRCTACSSLRQSVQMMARAQTTSDALMQACGVASRFAFVWMIEKLSQGSCCSRHPKQHRQLGSAASQLVRSTSGLTMNER